MKTVATAITAVVAMLMVTGARRAVKYIDPKTVVSACRRFKPDRRNSRTDFVLKIGAPNYRERHFIKMCKAAGEPFPVKRVQVQPWPAKRKAAK